MTKPEFVCSPENPWKDEYGKENFRRGIEHTNAYEFDSCLDGCCAYMRCKDCGTEWRMELPE